MTSAIRGFINPWLANAATSFAHSTQPFRIGIAHDLDACAAAWRLFETDAAATVFQTYAWMETWQRTVGAARGTQPRIALVRDSNGKLVMILPLAVERILGVPTLVWLAQSEADYHAPLVAPLFAETCTATQMGKILHMIAGLVPEANAISLGKTVRTIDGVANPMALVPHTAHPSSAHAILLRDDFQTLYEACVSKNSRRKDRRRRARLESFGATRMVVANTPAQQHEQLNIILMQKAKWLADRGISDPFEATDVQDLLHGLIDNPQTRESLHIAILQVGDEIAAGSFGYIHNHRYYAVIGSLTESELARFAPGKMLMHDRLRWCYENGIKVFDLTIGDEGYKDEWCDSHLELLDIRLPLTISGYLAILPARIFAAVKRYIKKSPRLLNLAMSGRRIVRSWMPA